VTPAGLAFERFPATITDEWMMRIGAADAPPILIVPPLFEEMNRTRALLAAVMRRLAAMGHGCWLPDLSGTGESEVPLEDVAWYDWGHDVTSAAGHVAAHAGKPLIASLRGGTLIDERAGARGWWRFAPVEGAMLARDLVRSGLAGGVEYAGYAPHDEMKASLAAAKPAAVAPLRTARLASDSGEADVRLDGPALWRRSEPGFSAALAEAMAADIADWSRACAAS
jgi:hypothetical protein